MNLTPKELEELRYIAYANKGASGIRRGSMPEANNPHVAGNLCRKGLLRGLRQSEYIRGERRRSFWIFEVTEAGKAALASLDRTRAD